MKARFGWVILAGLAIGSMVPLPAYVSNRSVWPSGEVTVLLQLGASDAALADGSASFDVVAEWVVDRWNPFMNRTKMVPLIVPRGDNTEDNGQNNVIFGSTAYGDDLEEALAITSSFRRIGEYRTEVDITVNSEYDWDSYRGDLDTDTEDLRRVLLHEFGHFIGLGHPDDELQFVNAIMNSVVTDADGLLDDDVEGVVYLYGLEGNEGGVGDADDHGGLFATATGVGADSTTPGALQDWDRDIFEINISKVGALDVRSTGDLDTWGYLIDETGFVWAANDDAGEGENFRAIFPVLPGETYYVVVEGYSGDTEGDYAMVAELLPDFLNGDEVRASFEEATVLQPNDSFSEALNYSIDTDTYRIDLPEAGFLTVQTTGDTLLSGALFEADETLLDLQFASRFEPNFLIESDYLQPGDYYVEVFSFFGEGLGPYNIVTSFEAVDPATLTEARLVNLSVRTGASGDLGPLIMGFVTENAEKQLLLRASGPSLADFGVTDHLGDPVMSLKNAAGEEIAENDDWLFSDDFLTIPTLAEELGAFEQTSFRDAAIIARSAPGAYTLVVDDFDKETGQVLIEAYDADELERRGRLMNLSTRAEIGVNDAALTAGFVVAGEGTLQVLIRGVGPELANFGVDGVLADPELEVFDAAAQSIASNEDWGSANGSLNEVFSQVGAFPLSEASADAALLVELAPGVYTVQLKGKTGQVGQGLIEIYVVE